jgi:hypothetical protein
MSSIIDNKKRLISIHFIILKEFLYTLVQRPLWPGIWNIVGFDVVTINVLKDMLEFLDFGENTQVVVFKSYE